MSLFKNKYRVESIRLNEYDYSQSGIYFVTICCGQKQYYFGEIKNGCVLLSSIGQMAKQCWLEIPQHFPNVVLDEYVIMPNHIHGLFKIVDHGHNVETQNFVSLPIETPMSQNKFQHIVPRSIGSIIRGYKIGVTKWCRNNDYQYFGWQKNYYERIIRGDDELNGVREYIKNNPINWDRDRNNV